VHYYDACYLPNGRIAFLSTACFQGVPCNAGVIVGMLYTMNGDGSGIRQICFEQDHEYCPTVLHDGRTLVAYYNCQGCHRLEGNGGAIIQHLARATLAPPSLEGEGARVQPSWLVGFLQRPSVLRPWFSIRMPDYGLSQQEATVLTRYLAALADLSNADEPIPGASPAEVTRGLQRFASLQCIQCHAASADAKPPPGIDPADLAIDLGLAKKRLRPSWIPRFIARPKTVAGEQSRMPAIFYTADGAPKVDDPTSDVAAITAFLLHVDGSPQAAVAAHKAERAAEPKQAPTDWSTYDY
jgi:mono/diheme cytochrome c family protein